jgi:hypothetical protein
MTTTAVETVSVNVGDPDVTPALITIGLGGTLKWTNNSTKYSQIEISFVGPSPAGAASIFTGTTSVEVPVNIAGSFLYTILHISESSVPKTSGPFAVRSCRSC